MRNIISLIVFFTILSPFASSGWSGLQFVGVFSLYLSLALLFLVTFSLLVSKGELSKAGFFPIILLFLLFFLIFILFEANSDFFSRFGQLLFICFSIFISKNINLKYDDMVCIIDRGSNLSAILLISLNLIGLFWGWDFAGGVENPNTLGMIAVGLSAWALMKNESGVYMTLYRLVIIFSGAGLVIISMSRTALISFIVLILIRYSYSWIIKRKIIYGFFSCFFLMLPILVVVVYVGPLANILNDVYLKYFSGFSDKRFESGREIVWNIVLDAGGESPLIGWGFSANPGNFSNILEADGLSSHNLYLQIFLQSGLIGIFVWFVLFIYIFFEIWKMKNNYYGMGAFSFFASMLLFQCFEVSLIQNNFNVASNFWILLMCVFAIGLKSNKQSRRLFQLK